MNTKHVDHYQIDSAYFYSDDLGHHLEFDGDESTETLTFADWDE